VCRPLTTGEVAAAHRLISDVFHEQVAPLYSQEGVRTFLEYIAEEDLARRASRDHELLGVENRDTGELLGVAELRRANHIALLFVRSDSQKKGVGRMLLDYIRSSCRMRGRRVITVNAAPNAVDAYTAMGFVAQGPEQEQEGIRSVPMIRSVDDES
jgi:GNAT superfamily N-acetyltransferase